MAAGWRRGGDLAKDRVGGSLLFTPSSWVMSRSSWQLGGSRCAAGLADVTARVVSGAGAGSERRWGGSGAVWSVGRESKVAGRIVMVVASGGRRRWATEREQRQRWQQRQGARSKLAAASSSNGVGQVRVSGRCAR